ncbi:hypothetical protein DSM112329_05151 [Paraconexibacter sp. AEG42_29]|uniref:Calcium-binding protein n=1 Tax=Paraconexibacter sp. AEG42_29 TaxID=2997339 RepID=A0AAU7B2Y7_9ACTN
MVSHFSARATRRRTALAATAALLTLGGLAGASGAAAATAQWTCSAEAVTASVAGMSTLNPLTVAHTPCTDQVAGLPNTTNAVGLAPSVGAKSAYAITSAKPVDAIPAAQSVGAATGVEGLTLNTGAGAVVIGVGAAESEANAICRDGAVVLSGASHVADLTINGRTVSLDGLLGPLTDAISDSGLSALLSIRLNEQVRTATGLTQSAAHIKLLSVPGGPPVAEVFVARSTVSSASACDPAADGNGGGNGGGSGGGTGGGGAGGSGSGGGSALTVCPAGATLDPSRVVCVITAAASGGAGEITIGRPFSGPAGGSVTSLVNARKKYKSPCLDGPGPKFVVLGTAKADRITGRNDADRILGLGGNDSLDGGRGNDCLDGGTGGDGLNGATGNDRIFGQTGKDHLNGGPGKDRLDGGAGDDSINAGFGADTITGGSGVDFVNVATAGPAARVNCGSGKDVVRLNRNEKRRTTACERRYVLND